MPEGYAEPDCAGMDEDVENAEEVAEELSNDEDD